MGLFHLVPLSIAHMATLVTSDPPTDQPSGPKHTTVTSADAANDRPDTPHPSYLRMKPRWEKCRALMGGTQAIRDGGEAYLPRFPREGLASYEVRKKLTAVFNGYASTVLAFVGIILEKNPALGDDMAPELKTIAEDVDQQGTHLDVYARRIALDAMVDGHMGTLVDWPVVENAERLTADEENRLGLRPFAVRYEARDILKLMYGKIDGVKVITLLVLQQTTEELVGSFGVREVTRYRVYRRSAATGITWEVWARNEAGTGVDRTAGPTPLRGPTRIPFSLFIAGQRVGDFETRPPLENLADLNLEHHQVKTNIRQLETLACVPTRVRIGARPLRVEADGTGVYPDIVSGPDRTIEAPYMDGIAKPIYWDQPDVSVLEPSARSLQDIKADMGAAGLSFLAPDKRAAETAEAKRIDQRAQHATIGSVSRAEQDHLEEVFGFMADYLSRRGTAVKAGSVTLNRDFEATLLDPAMLTALTNAASAGKLSLPTFLSLLERFRLLPEGFDADAEVKLILTEGRLSDPPPEPQTV